MMHLFYLANLFFTFLATFCTVMTTNSSILYKFLPSMLLIIYSTMLENVGKYYLTTCMFVIRLQPIVRIFLRCIHM